MKYALDSDVLIAFLKGDPAAHRFLKENAQETTTTIITALEILSGVLPSTRREREALVTLQAFEPKHLDWNAMIASATVTRNLERRGNPIGQNDEVIAGICIANDLALVTQNKKHFTQVSGLKTKIW